jgi:hypothetical protein
MDRIPQSMIDDLATALAAKLGSTGGTLTGDLTINKAGGAGGIILNKAASGQDMWIEGRMGGVRRWLMMLGDGVAESAPQTGSDWNLHRYTNTGAYIDTPMAIARANGELLLKNRRAFEYTTNANGGALRFADGTQIAFRAINTSSLTTNPGDIISLSSEAWTYPAAFTAAPAGFISFKSGWASEYHVVFEGITATNLTGIYLHQRAGTTRTQIFTIFTFAVGRWY